MSTIYGIGLGPGDPELITLKALRTMQESDIVVVPQSDKMGTSVARKIIAPHLREEQIYMYHFPMTNDEDDLADRYTALADDMAQMVRSGKKVCYVTIGDATIFSTFAYLAQRLRFQGVETALIPGIPSFIAASNILSTSIVEKGERFCVVEMPDNTDELNRLTEAFDTVICMKVHKRLGTLVQFAGQFSGSCHLVKRAYLDGEELLNLKTDTPDDKAGYLSVAIIARNR